MLLTNTDPEGKKIAVSKELNATFPKCSRLFLVWHPANLMKSIHHFVHAFAHRYDRAPIWGTVYQSTWAWEFSQLFCCSVSNISWKCHWNPFTNFSVMLLVSMDPENIKINQDCSLSNIRPVLKISWESINPFFSVMLLTDTDSPGK